MGKEHSPNPPQSDLPKALLPQDFRERPQLHPEFLRTCETWLSDQQFSDKAAAIWPKGAWLAMRAHPAGLWADLAQLPPALLPGAEGICLGDAHFDNFGFIHVPGEKDFVFAPNDLDDGGVGPVVLDALKYFAVLADQPRLQGYLDLLLERYVEVLHDEKGEHRIPKHLWPHPESVYKKKLAKHVADDKIRRDALPFQSEPLSEPELESLKSALSTAPQLRGSVLLDAVDQYKLAGGSYGGERYWVLIDRAHKAGLDLLEFKAMSVPATSLGRQSRSMTQWQRIEFLKKHLWSSTSDEDYFVARLTDRDFLVRSRLRKSSLAPLEMTEADDVDDVLKAQVSFMAALHRPAMAGMKREHMRYWLRESATLLLARWQDLLARFTQSGGPEPPPAGQTLPAKPDVG